MSDDMSCTECSGKMKAVGRERHVFQPDPETMTDGQLAEQHAARLGGFFEEGVHGSTAQVYECRECGHHREVSS